MNVGFIAWATVIILALAGGAVYGISSLRSYGQQQHDAGYQEARTDALTRGVELVKERDALDASIKRTATPADMCARLGGKWVPDASAGGGECD